MEDDLPSGEEVYNITRTLETQHGDAAAAEKTRIPQTGPEGASQPLIRPGETAWCAPANISIHLRDEQTPSKGAAMS